MVKPRYGKIIPISMIVFWAIFKEKWSWSWSWLWSRSLPMILIFLRKWSRSLLMILIFDLRSKVKWSYTTLHTYIPWFRLSVAVSSGSEISSVRSLCFNDAPEFLFLLLARVPTDRAELGNMLWGFHKGRPLFDCFVFTPSPICPFIHKIYILFVRIFGEF